MGAQYAKRKVPQLLASSAKILFRRLDQPAATAPHVALVVLRYLHVACFCSMGACLRLPIPIIPKFERLTGACRYSMIGNYADTMMLWEALGIASPFPSKSRRAGGRYSPIILLNDHSTIDAVAEKLVSLFSPVCADERTMDAVRTMLRELIDNCYSQSAVQGGLYGMICAQVWAGGRKAQIVLCDSGVGIRASLHENNLLHARLANENSCTIAMEFGVTGKPGRGHSGYGLSVAPNLLKNNNGMLYVRSGREAFALLQNVEKSVYTKHRWDGTLLVIEWNLDKQVDISDVYNTLPLPEGFDDDDFFA